MARQRSILGYAAGHTHRHRVRRVAGGIPTIEVGCVKDFPGTWAEYRVYEGGVMQVVHRISSPDALRWSERCRHLYSDFGVDYEAYALGTLERALLHAGDPLRTSAVPLAEAVRAAAVPPFHAMAMARLASELESRRAPDPAPRGRPAVHGCPGGRAPGGDRRARPRRPDGLHERARSGVAAGAHRAAVPRPARRRRRSRRGGDRGRRVGRVHARVRRMLRRRRPRRRARARATPATATRSLALGIEPVPLPVGPETRWAPTPELLDAAGRLDGLVIASPSNPTGTVLDEPTLAAVIAAWCAAQRRPADLRRDLPRHRLRRSGRRPPSPRRAMRSSSTASRSTSR